MKQRTMNALRPLHLPDHVKHTLPNGLVVHLLRNSALPLVSVRLMVRAGDVYDTEALQGTADFACRLMRRGAAQKTANQISDAIDFVGAALSGFANEENAVVAMSTPAQHFEPMLQLMAEVALQPSFETSELELMRRRTLAQLQNELDDPGSLAEKAISKAVWGEHPYGQESTGTLKSIAALDAAHLKHFHQTRFASNSAHLFISGDIYTDKVLKLIAASDFGQWKRASKSMPDIAKFEALAQPGKVILVDKPEQTQVQMRIGAMGIPRSHRDFFAASVVSAVLGGTFTSRLMQEIRVKRGLSYGAGCGFEMMSSGGTFSVSSFTKTERVKELLDVALGEVKKMRDKGPTASELSTVQRYISGLYPARLETNDGLLGAVADVVHHQLPDDFIRRFRANVVGVSVADAKRAARELLFADQRAIVLVGNAEALKPVASRFGEVLVKRIDEV
jgi:zinc protease